MKHMDKVFKSAAFAVALLSLAGCSNSDSADKLDNKNPTGAEDAVVKTDADVSDAQKLYDAISTLAEQYKEGTILKEDVTKALSNAVVLQSAVDKNINDMNINNVSAEDKGIIENSWGMLNEFDKDTMVFDVADGKAEYDSLYESVKDICKSVGIEVYDIVLSESEVSMQCGDTMSIDVQVKGSDKGVTWVTPDDKVVSVSENGEIKANGVGACTVMCVLNEDENVFKTVNITIEGVGINKIEAQPLNIKEGEKGKLDVKVNEDATDKTLVYKVSDENIATVDANGNVTAKKEGECKVTITSPDGKCSVDVTIKVGNKFGVEKIDEKVMYSKGGNFRAEPNTNSEKISYVDINNEVKVIGKTGEWYYAEIDGTKGFMHNTVVSDGQVSIERPANNNYNDNNNYNESNWGSNNNNNDNYNVGSFSNNNDNNNSSNKGNGNSGNSNSNSNSSNNKPSGSGSGSGNVGSGSAGGSYEGEGRDPGYSENPEYDTNVG